MQALSALADLRHLLLGFDLPPEQGRRLVAEYQQLYALVAGDPADRQTLLTAELDVLAAFADLCELTRNRPHAEDTRDDRVHSPREYFHRYLHSLDADRERLPEDFRIKLSRVLGQYGLTSLARTEQLEEAVYRIFLAQQHTPSHVPAVTALLERWLTDPMPAAAVGGRTRDVLDRLVLATQLRYPAAGDLARSARYRWFEAPLTEASREEVFAQVRRQLDELSTDPPPADHEARVEALVACPEPLVRFLSERLESGFDHVQPMLEVLARRHYREYTLHDLAGRVISGRPVVTADYTLDDRPTHLVSTVARIGELTPDGDLTAVLRGLLAQTPSDHQPVVDLYLEWVGAPAEDEAAALELADLVAALPFAGTARRIAITVCAGSKPVRQFTFRPAGYGTGRPGPIVEDVLVRGLHPMVGRRLDLWRLRDFSISRLDTGGDVLLYRCVAPDNDADVRLVAIAQVRELSVVRDGAGRVTSLPQVERAVAGCLDAVRRARA
ncbi:MAG: hypothetical protein WAL50_01155, partial [Kineosporiaceae bacterium]